MNTQHKTQITKRIRIRRTKIIIRRNTTRIRNSQIKTNETKHKQTKGLIQIRILIKQIIIKISTNT